MELSECVRRFDLCAKAIRVRLPWYALFILATYRVQC